jgi:hypothetical protein
MLDVPLDIPERNITIEIQIYDGREHELKINSTQMSGKIRVCMISTIDKIYKKILLNFKITNAIINPSNTTIITYYGEYYVPLFRQTNIGHIWMPLPCPKPITCQQGGHINANTWEMLHKIAEMTGLGFAATKQCKEISDRAVRNVYTQRFDKFIYDQIAHCGLGKENIFDAWVDLYGYIVMVNIPWIMDQDLSSEDLDIVASTDLHGTSNDLPEQNPQKVERTLTNYNKIGALTNLEIEHYSLEVSNDAVNYGTLEHVYIIDFKGTKTELRELDVQTKQHSIDGEFIEDYNTGMNNPIPKFNFNIDEYTELPGGYDLDEQKKIRDAYFRKLRQSVLTVRLKYLNFGLQRGTLVNIVIFENDMFNKMEEITHFNNVVAANDKIKQTEGVFPPEVDERKAVQDDGNMFANFKLTGLYYIDGMNFIYSTSEGRIIQELILLKKGPTSGYQNRHTAPKVDDTIEAKPTLPQSPGFIEEYNQ